MADVEKLLSAGDRAFVDEDFGEAVKCYTQAIEAQPSNALAYESRANAHIKLENYLEAAEDAAKAIELNPTSKAYLRRGVACFHLDEFESAKQAFEAGAKLAPENAQFKTWIRKCQAEIDDAEGAQPASAAPAAAPAAPSTSQPAQAPAPAAPAPATAAPAASAAGQAPLAPAAPAEAQGKYRHQWYQLQDKVTVDVYAKNLPKEKVQVTFEEQRLSVVIAPSASEAGEEPYKLEVELYGKVKPDQCRYEVLRTKVEIVMQKADTHQWGSLQKSAQVAAPNYSNPTMEPVAGKYPSSYVKAPKDWSKVEAEVKELEQKGELEDGDPLNNFFKKIFAQGDEDQRRAMMKSFVESNGTVLSTNWSEVGSKKVECTPPDGMEARKWEK